MKKFTLFVIGIFCPVIVSLFLAACGGSSSELTYRVSGDADEASVAYKDAEGNTKEEKVSLPWETSFGIGNEFDAEWGVESNYQR